MRIIVRGLALASLSCLPLWKHLIFRTPEQSFLRAHPPAESDLAATLSLVLILAFLLALLDKLSIARPFFRTLFYLLCSLLLFASLYGLLAPRIADFHFNWSGPRPWVAVIALLGIFAFFAAQRPVRKLVAAILPFTALLIPVFTLQAFLSIRVDSHLPDSLPPASVRDHPQAQARFRVLWIIFDEWDYRISFDDPHPPLPHIQRLRDQSVFLTQAFPPADATLRSVPALLYGHPVAAAAVDPTSLRLRLRFPNGESVFFGDEPNVFSRARELGVPSAVAGWYLPYCHSMQAALADCWWGEFNTQASTVIGGSFKRALALQSRSLLETALFSPFGQSLVVQAHARLYNQLLQQALELASRTSPSLTFLHFNVPHPPFIFDPGTRRTDRANTLRGYAGNLALLDETVGLLRARLDQTGSAANTILILSSDHSYRDAPPTPIGRDYRVPFLVHFPAQHSSFDYRRRFDTVRTAALIEQVLTSTVTTPQDLLAWLDR